jgi:hypothetical protein
MSPCLIGRPVTLRLPGSSLLETSNQLWRYTPICHDIRRRPTYVISTSISYLWWEAPSLVPRRACKPDRGDTRHTLQPVAQLNQLLYRPARGSISMVAGQPSAFPKCPMVVPIIRFVRSAKAEGNRDDPVLSKLQPAGYAGCTAGTTGRNCRTCPGKDPGRLAPG